MRVCDGRHLNRGIEGLGPPAGRLRQLLLLRFDSQTLLDAWTGHYVLAKSDDDKVVQNNNSWAIFFSGVGMCNAPVVHRWPGEPVRYGTQRLRWSDRCWWTVVRPKTTYSIMPNAPVLIRIANFLFGGDVVYTLFLSHLCQ
jgi:hypothetical protein